MLGSFRFKPFHGKILLTNDAGQHCFLAKEEFQSFVAGKLPKDTVAYKLLEERYFCKDAATEVYLRRAVNAVRENHAYLFSPTELFILAITNQCNERCLYCQANGGASAAKMDLNTARKIVERISETPACSVSIEFQGGEPLTNLPVIKEVVAYSKECLKNKSVEYSLVSNLSLVNDEIADFIADNGINVSTSLDGPQWLHEFNRPCAIPGGSFNAMLKGKQLLEKRGLRVGAIQTTTRASLNAAKEIVQAYIDTGFDSIFLRPLTMLGAAKQRWHEIGYTPEEFLSFYKAGLEEIIAANKAGIAISERHASIFLQKILACTSPNYMELRSPCGAALGQLAFTSSGNVYTCDEGRMVAEMGDEAFRLGNVFENGYEEWIEHPSCKATCQASLLENIPACCDCAYQPYCGVCPVVNYALTGSIYANQPNNDRCKVYRGMLDILFEKILENNSEVMKIFYDWSEE